MEDDGCTCEEDGIELEPCEDCDGCESCGTCPGDCEEAWQ
jgi:hypothetical protein